MRRLKGRAEDARKPRLVLPSCQAPQYHDLLQGQTFPLVYCITNRTNIPLYRLSKWTVKQTFLLVCRLTPRKTFLDNYTFLLAHYFCISFGA